MAITGPPPSERRRRTNKDTYADVQATVAVTDEVRGPVLEGDWLPETVRWYETWRRSPQAAVFVATDWQRLAMLAPLVDDYFDRPHHLKLAEVRQNESLLGATHVDRLRARIKVEAKPAATPPGVAAMDDYRTRLAG